MSLDIQQEVCAGRLQIHLSGELDIYAAATLRESLQQIVSQHHEIEILLADVSEVDGAGLQVLVAAKNEALRQGARLSLSDHSVAVVNALQLCRLDRFFGDPIVLTREMP
jgi:anti-anti-sigma factor